MSKTDDLTPNEQKTTAAFKLLTKQNKTLKSSLKKTQDELESWRAKYYQADKDNAVQKGSTRATIFHEVLKLLISSVCGGAGVNYLMIGEYATGSVILFLGLIFYACVLWSDKK